MIGHVIVTWTEHGNLRRMANGGEPGAGWEQQNVKVEDVQRSKPRAVPVRSRRKLVTPESLTMSKRRYDVVHTPQSIPTAPSLRKKKGLLHQFRLCD